MKRIGIFSGTFDPVHKGHIAFALEAMASAKLDQIYFMPESKPRRKEGITHYSHRIAMLRVALKPYRNLKLLETPDKQFSVAKTMPRLTRQFKDDKLLLLVGSDAAEYFTSAIEWPNAEKLLKRFGLVVGLRSLQSEQGIHELLVPVAELLPELHIITTDSQHSSSRDIRQAVSKGNTHEAQLVSLREYISQHWLYGLVPEVSLRGQKR